MACRGFLFSILGDALPLQGLFGLVVENHTFQHVLDHQLAFFIELADGLELQPKGLIGAVCRFAKSNIGDRGASGSVTSDTSIEVFTEWLDQDGNARPEGLSDYGFTGRVAKLVGDKQVGDASLAHFPIKPAHHVQVTGTLSDLRDFFFRTMKTFEDFWNFVKTKRKSSRVGVISR